MNNDGVYWMVQRLKFFDLMKQKFLYELKIKKR